jgi:DNA-binding transcriptional MerR regulator
MTVLLTIGDFSRMTHLSVKALRHYHDVGLLEPATVDRSSGYRLYDAEQVPIAQVIRRFRELGMPVDEVKSVLSAPDVTTRNQVIVAHLERMEDQLEQTKATVASLRAVLEAPRAPAPVEYRSLGSTPTLAIRETVTAAGMEAWWVGAFQELRKVLSESGAERAGPDGCLYPNEMFELEVGEMVAFVPVTSLAVGSGRVQPDALSPVELAIMVHEGSYGELDQTYGTLGTYVAERAIGVEGPIRELYLISPLDEEDPAGLRTELGWPVFRAG